MTQIFKSDPKVKEIFDYKIRRLQPGDSLVIADMNHGIRVPLYRHGRFLKWYPQPGWPERFVFVDDIGDERDAWLDDIDSIWLEPMTADEAEALMDSYCKWDLPENWADAVHRLQYYSYYDFFTPDGQIKNAEAQNKLDAIIYERDA